MGVKWHFHKKWFIVYKQWPFRTTININFFFFFKWSCGSLLYVCMRALFSPRVNDLSRRRARLSFIWRASDIKAGPICHAARTCFFYFYIFFIYFPLSIFFFLLMVVKLTRTRSQRETLTVQKANLNFAERENTRVYINCYFFIIATYTMSLCFRALCARSRLIKSKQFV